jgi:putative oxidoreductase
MPFAWGLLILRSVIGLSLAGHGSQKIFGWFGGPGFTKFEQGLQAKGFTPPLLWTSLAILGELGGGLSLASGFLTPLGAVGIIGAMVIAIAQHWKNGFWGMKGGYEYPLALLAIGLAIGLTGPGSLSLDAFFHIALPVQLFGVLLLATLIVDGVGIFMSRPTSTSAMASATRPVQSQQ